VQAGDWAGKWREAQAVQTYQESPGGPMSGFYKDYSSLTKVGLGPLDPAGMTFGVESPLAPLEYPSKYKGNIAPK
jgi:hypothetical protein